MAKQVNVEEALHHRFAMRTKQDFVTRVKLCCRRDLRSDANVFSRYELNLIWEISAAAGWTNDFIRHFLTYLPRVWENGPLSLAWHKPGLSSKEGMEVRFIVAEESSEGNPQIDSYVQVEK